MNLWFWQLALLICMVCIPTLNAFANCSRPIKVPTSALNTASNNTSGEVKRNNFSNQVMRLMDRLGEKLGCQFNYIVVPKARQELLFKNGEADILFMATKTPKRDEVGQLIPLMQIRPAIISNKNFQSSRLSLKNIQENQNIQLVLVRGFDYGAEYQALISLIEKQKRVSYEPDVFSVARMMTYKNSVATIIIPSHFEEVLKNEIVLNPLIGNIQYDAIEEFQWLDVGIYISNVSLEEKDAIFLKRHLPLLIANDHIWKWIQSKYSKELVGMSFRQLNVSPSKKIIN